MKKFAYVIAALAAAFAVSCTKETPLETPKTDAPEMGMKEVTITASVDQATKTAYDADGKFSWTKGDQISVLGTNKKFYTLTADGTGAKTTFSGKVDKEVELTSIAFYPADEKHACIVGEEWDSYQFNIPEYKDLTATFSADMPLGSNRDEDGVYKFKHMTGAALLTFTNLQDYVAAEITITNESLKLSGIFSPYKNDEGLWIYGSQSAPTGGSKFIRKIKVVDGQVQMYLPYPSNLWQHSYITIIGFDAAGNKTELLKDKRMKANGTAFPRATIVPYAPLVLNHLNNVDWENALTTTVDPSAEYSRLKELKVAADKHLMYIRLNASLADTYEGDYLDIFLSDGNGTSVAWYGWTTLGTDVYKDGLSSHKGSIDKATGNLTAMKFMQGETQVNLDVVSKVLGEDAYWYIVVPRDYLEPYTNNGKVYVSFMLWKSWTPYGVIPTMGTSMLEVTLP